MTALFNLQNQFQTYLLTSQTGIDEAIVQSEKISVDQRLSIYLDAYRYRLLDSLVENFPVLSAYLGCDNFQTLGRSYIDNYPSPYRSIRWFGDSFATYLQRVSEPYLSELAEFEWKMTLAFDAADEDALNLEEVAAIPPESWATIRFTPHPSLQRMDFLWNSVDLWQAISDEQLPPPPPLKNDSPKHWALWRRDYINRFYPLPEDEAWALDALINQATFGEICEGLCEWVDEQEVGMRAASLLKSWVQSGLLAGIHIES